MPLTTVPANLKPIVWDKKYFADYIRANRFKKVMGKTINDIIQLKEDLTGKKGTSIYIELVNELTGDGVTGNQTLEGNEEALSQRSFQATVSLIRHAVAVDELEEQSTEIDLRNAAREQLQLWSMKKLRTKIINALGSIDGVLFANATAAQKNTWQDNNNDRVLFGAAKSNLSAGAFATSLGNVDSTNDKLSKAIVSLAKRMAKNSSPIIRPVNVTEDEEWYVMFVPSRAFRDLSLDTNLVTDMRNALPRAKDNPLFTGGDLVTDGVIIKEIPEIGYLTGVGASNIDVAPCYLCGAQALAAVWAQRTKTKTDVRDYGFRNGVAIQEMYDVHKLRFGTGAADTTTPKDHGMVTVFVSGVADA